MAWATVEQVAAHIGVPEDDTMTVTLAVSDAWCRHQRPDLVALEAAATEEDPFTCPADVAHAVVIYAALLWREKSSPQGFAGYQEEGGTVEALDAMANVYRLLGSRRPVAR